MLIPEILEQVERETRTQRLKNSVQKASGNSYWATTPESRNAFASYYCKFLLDNCKTVWNEDFTQWVRSPVRFISYRERSEAARTWWTANDDMRQSISDDWIHDSLVDATELISLYVAHLEQVTKSHLSEEDRGFSDELIGLKNQSFPAKPFNPKIESIIVNQRLEAPDDDLFAEIEKTTTQTKPPVSMRLHPQTLIELLERADLVVHAKIERVENCMGRAFGEVRQFETAKLDVIGFLRSMDHDFEPKTIVAGCMNTLRMPSVGQSCIVFIEFDPTNPTYPFWILECVETKDDTNDGDDKLIRRISLMTPIHGCIKVFTIPMRENFTAKLSNLEETAQSRIQIEDFKTAEKICKAVLSKMVPGNSRWKAPFFGLLSEIWDLAGDKKRAECAAKEQEKCLKDSGQ